MADQRTGELNVPSFKMPHLSRDQLELDEKSRLAIILTKSSEFYFLREGIEIEPNVSSYEKLVRFAKRFVVDNAKYVGILLVGETPDDDMQVHRADNDYEAQGYRYAVVFKVNSIPSAISNTDKTTNTLAESFVDAMSKVQVSNKRVHSDDDSDNNKDFGASAIKRTKKTNDVGHVLKRFSNVEGFEEEVGSYVNRFLEYADVPNDDQSISIAKRICPSTFDDKCFHQLQSSSTHWKYHVNKSIPTNWDHVASALEELATARHKEHIHLRVTDIEKALESDDPLTAICNYLATIGHFTHDDRKVQDSKFLKSQTLRNEVSRNLPLLGFTAQDTEVRPFKEHKAVVFEKVDIARTDTHVNGQEKGKHKYLE